MRARKFLPIFLGWASGAALSLVAVHLFTRYMSLEQYLLSIMACGSGVTLALAALVLVYVVGVFVGRRNQRKEGESNGQ